MARLPAVVGLGRGPVAGSAVDLRRVCAQLAKNESVKLGVRPEAIRILKGETPSDKEKPSNFSTQGLLRGSEVRQI